MKTARQLLDEKGRQVWSVNSDATVFDALRLMAEKEIGALLVMDEGAIVGLISERDYARKVILEGRSSRETPVADIYVGDGVARVAATNRDRLYGLNDEQEGKAPARTRRWPDHRDFVDRRSG